MATTLYAYTDICFSPSDAKSKKEIKRFSVGDKVTGIPKAEMQRLIEAGAVVKYERDAEPEAVEAEEEASENPSEDNTSGGGTADQQ